MRLIASVKKGQLELQDTSLTLQMNLHQGLLLMAALDEALGLPDTQTQKQINAFYLQLLESLMLLGVRERQLVLNEASLEALACLLRRFRNQPMEVALRDNLSQRRLGQVEEEPLYLKASLSAVEELTQVLSPFFSNINQQLKDGRINLQDPKGVYF